jgi:hypothetical protein
VYLISQAFFSYFFVLSLYVKQMESDHSKVKHRRITVQAAWAKSETLSPKQPEPKGLEGMAQLVGHLPLSEALTPKKKKKKRKKEI